MAINPLTGQEDDEFGFNTVNSSTVSNSQTSSSPTVAPPEAPQTPEGPGGEVPDYQSMAEVPTSTQPTYTPSTTQNQYGQGLYDFGFQALSQPSRFDSSVVQQGIDVINRAIDKQRTSGTRSLDEMHASRGLTGSSVEADNRRLFEEELQGQASGRMSDLAMEQARTFASDRASAAGIGLDVGRYGEERGRYGYEANRMTSRDQEDDLRYRAQLAMQAGQLEEAARLSRSADELARSQFGFGSQMDIAEFLETQRQFGGSFGLESQRLEEARASRLQQFGLDTRALDQEAQRLVSQAQLEGRSLDLAQARDQAEIGLRSQQLMQEAQLQGRTLDLQQARDQATQQIEGQRLEETRNARLQQLGIDSRSLDLEAQQLVQQAQLEGRSLDLTQARDQAETTYRAQQLTQQAAQFGQTLTLDQARLATEVTMQRERLSQQETEFARSLGLDERQFTQQQTEFSQTYAEQIASRLQEQNQFAASLGEETASRVMEDRLRTTALTFQREGMSLDEAYRRASLEQEGQLQQEALRLEELGITKEDSYRYAALIQDDKFNLMADNLQRDGMRLDEAYRQTELRWKQAVSAEQLVQSGTRVGLEGQSIHNQATQFRQSAALSQMDIILRAIASGVPDLGKPNTSVVSSSYSPYGTSAYGSYSPYSSYAPYGGSSSYTPTDPFGFGGQVQQFDPNMIYQLLQYMSQQQPQQYGGTPYSGGMTNSYYGF